MGAIVEHNAKNKVVKCRMHQFCEKQKQFSIFSSESGAVRLTFSVDVGVDFERVEFRKREEKNEKML